MTRQTTAPTRALTAAEMGSQQADALIARAAAYRALRRYAEEATDLQTAFSLASQLQQPTVSARLTEVHDLITPTALPPSPVAATATATLRRTATPSATVTRSPAPARTATRTPTP